MIQQEHHDMYKLQLMHFVLEKGGMHDTDVSLSYVCHCLLTSLRLAEWSLLAYVRLCGSLAKRMCRIPNCELYYLNWRLFHCGRWQ